MRRPWGTIRHGQLCSHNLGLQSVFGPSDCRHGCVQPLHRRLCSTRRLL